MSNADHVTEAQELLLDNGVLRVAVSSMGAEMQSLRRLDTGTEYLWQGDPAVWPRRAPWLFPIVGRLRGDRYTWQGCTYCLPQHGFARDSLFRVASADPGSVSLALTDSTATRASFPFAFRLSISYRLAADTLVITAEVTNPGPGVLPFSFGGHPGFRCPLVPGEPVSDYEISFEHRESSARWLVEDGLIGRTREGILDGQRALPLVEGLFARGALVFKDLRSETVRLHSRRAGNGVDLEFPGFPYFGIWSKPPGPFVCLEPWCGIADPVDASGRLEDKEGIVLLSPGRSFVRRLVIRPY
ncbi:MAG: aldose 1-epimerase family protein [Thermoanaerobaculaceae bacterium]|jgi:galactose mutarotase-like enzyme|nr:aldose 1-epimerase family protein [Thermoanaerobaculaceae bacterium]